MSEEERGLTDVIDSFKIPKRKMCNANARSFHLMNTIHGREKYIFFLFQLQCDKEPNTYNINKMNELTHTKNQTSNDYPYPTQIMKQ